MPSSAIMLVPDISWSLGDVALHPVSKPHHSAAQCFRGDMPKRLTGCGPRIGVANKFENARHTGQSIYPRINQKADFIDQSLLQKCAIDVTAALEKDCLDSEGHQLARYCSSLTFSI